VVASSDVVVVGNGDGEFARILDGARPDQVIIDLVRIGSPGEGSKGSYQGIAW
jgi:hypothetical protein